MGKGAERKRDGRSGGGREGGREERATYLGGEGKQLIAQDKHVSTPKQCLPLRKERGREI